MAQNRLWAESLQVHGGLFCRRVRSTAPSVSIAGYLLLLVSCGTGMGAKTARATQRRCKLRKKSLWSGHRGTAYRY